MDPVEVFEIRRYLSTPCPYCGVISTYSTNFTNLDETKETKNKVIAERVRHILECVLKKVDTLSLDVSDMFLKDLTIGDLDEEDDEANDEDYIYMDEESDDELEMEVVQDLDDRLKETVVTELSDNTEELCDTKLKFKFMSGLNLEGNFKSSDAIHLVVRWVALKAEVPKEAIAFRVGSQLFENNDVLSNTATLEELKIKSGTLIQCFCRTTL